MIGIIYDGAIELAPFVRKYTAVFDRIGAEYEIISWNREASESRKEGNVYIYGESVGRYVSAFSKLKPVLNFRQYAKKIIREKKYEKLVILTTQTAIILVDTVLGKYRGKYFFDYRDASYEYIKPYGALVKSIAKNAAAAAVSSPGFGEYLGGGENLKLSHNFQTANYERRKLTFEKREGGKIVMGYVGILRGFDYLLKLTDIFGRDDRFELRFYGTGDRIMELRKKAEEYNNVFVMGAYAEKDKADIIGSFDMICYNYPNSFRNYPALANKFYDGMIWKKPLFANSRTFSGKLVEEKGVGISLDQEERDITSKIYDYYTALDGDKFAKSCEDYLSSVMLDEEKYIEEIEKFGRSGD